jgi:fatty aldehyde-generating acyl-ACP reductase
MGGSRIDAESHPGMGNLSGRHLMAPDGGRQVPWFSFVVHLRSSSDLDRWSTTAVMEGEDGEKWRDRVLRGPPLHASTFSFRSTPVTGDLIVIPRLPEDIIFGDGPEMVARAVQISHARGARVVGLGGLTAPATRGGMSLLPSLPAGLTLTNGNSYTAAVLRANVLEACEFLTRPRPLVAILGSTGSVGAAASQLLAEDGIDLLLIGRSTERARRTGPGVMKRIRYSGEVAEVAEADAVLALTSGGTAQLRPDHFDDFRERVVIDAAQPSNIAVADREAFRRRRIRVVRGGWVQMPGAISSQRHQSVMTDGEPAAPPGSAPACLAETCLFATEGIRKHSVGPGSAELAHMLDRVAAKRGVKVCPLPLEAVTPDSFQDDAAGA